MLKKLFVYILVCSAASGFAQRRELGMGFGFTNYRGDLAPRVQILNSRVGFELNHRYILNPAWMLRQSLFFGVLEAKDQILIDPKLRARDLEISGMIGSANFLAEYYFFNFRSKGYGRMNFSSYLFAGAGIGFSSMKESKTARSQTQFLPTLPYGVGIRKAVGLNWSYGIELATFQTFTDELDLTPYAKNGTTERNDVAYFLSFTLTYRFVKVICPKCIPIEPVF
jgi:hypothetical protein